MNFVQATLPWSSGHPRAHSCREYDACATILPYFFIVIRSKITVRERYYVPSEIVRESTLSEGTKKWEQQGCEVLLDAKEAQVQRLSAG